MDRRSHDDSGGGTNSTVEPSTVMSNRLTTLEDETPFPNGRFEEEIHDSLLRGKSILLLGPGGTGKTHTLKRMIRFLYQTLTPVDGGDGDSVPPIGITSVTGLAAYNLSTKVGNERVSGQTIHSWGGLGVPPEDWTLKQMLERVRRSKAVKNWKQAVYLVMDEISMLSGLMFELLDYVSREIRETDIVLGNIKFIASGDFLQLPPVNGDFVFKSEVWNMVNFDVFLFEKPQRYPDLNHFKMLLNIRLGEPTESDISILHSRAKAWSSYTPRKDGITPVFLFPTRAQTLKYNQDKLSRLPSPLVKFICRDAQLVKKPERFDAIRKKAVMDEHIPEAIDLKIGAQVIIKINIYDGKSRLVLASGTRGVIKNIVKLPYVSALSGEYSSTTPPPEEDYVVNVLWETGKQTTVTKFVFSVEDKSGIYAREQIPLVLAWAFSIHGCQGFTVEEAVIDPGRIFCPGQFYVAASRVKTLEGLYLTSFDPKKINAHLDAKKYMQTIAEHVKTTIYT